MALGPAPIPFEDRYVVRPNGCWEWIGAISSTGYGAIWVEGKSTTAHRVSYELNIGPIPEGAWILHSCDNPPCVNPRHLSAGTPAQNTQEAMERKRMTPCGVGSGEAHPTSKLTEVQALGVRDLYDQGWSCKDIGDAYGVNEQTIRLIGQRKNWKHLKEKVAA